MQPNKTSPLAMFGQPLQYLVPIFQRGYVWTVERQIQPLWADIVDRARELGRYDAIRQTAEAQARSADAGAAAGRPRQGRCRSACARPCGPCGRSPARGRRNSRAGPPGRSRAGGGLSGSWMRPYVAAPRGSTELRVNPAFPDSTSRNPRSRSDPLPSFHRFPRFLRPMSKTTPRPESLYVLPGN